MDVHEDDRVAGNAIPFERDVGGSDVWEPDWEDGAKAEGFVDESAYVGRVGEIFNVWKSAWTDDSVDFGLRGGLDDGIGE